MKTLSRFNLTILLSTFVVLPICNSSGNTSLDLTLTTTTYQMLHRFTGGTDGETPQSALIQDSDGNFYGTTTGGGGDVGNGTVFKITPQGQETVIYRFAGDDDGSFPVSGLIKGSDGNFYGTTASGGADNGTVYKITPQGQETVIYRFSGGNDGSDPSAALIQGSDGNFYGTTKFGGGDGTVFRITPQGQETVIYRFAGGNDGAFPSSALIKGNDGNFYGTTTYGGGVTGDGTVYRITPQGQETVLYSFVGGNDGAIPQAELIQASDGNFYGTTKNGGVKDYGTVFKVTPQGVETLLYSFAGGYKDGANPYAGLIQGNGGSLYGTTQKGGSLRNQGTIFKITLQG